MGLEFHDAASQWLIGFCVSPASALGALNKSTTSEVTKSYLRLGITGVLAPLLGFTLAMAVTRLEAQTLVVEESNAIGASYLRAQLAGSTQIHWTSMEIPLFAG